MHGIRWQTLNGFMVAFAFVRARFDVRASLFAAAHAPSSLVCMRQQLCGIHTLFLHVSGTTAGAPRALYIEDCALG
jgi:hypothetical protein